MPTYNLDVAAGLNLSPVVSAYVSPIQLSVSTGFGLRPSIAVQAIRTYQIAVQAGLGLRPAIALQATLTRSISVATTLGLSAAVSLDATRTYSLSVSASIALQPTVALARNQTFALAVSTRINLGAAVLLGSTSTHVISVSSGLGLSASLQTNIQKALAVATSLGLSATVSSSGTYNFTVATELSLGVTVFAPRTIILTVATGLSLAATATPDGRTYVFTVTSGLGLAPSVVASSGGLVVSATLRLTPSVICQVVLGSGVGIPGLTSTGGPQIHLWSNISGHYPLSFAETPSGVLLMANGVDPMLRWDGLSSVADVAGVLPPSSAPTITGTGLGAITGARYAFTRFVDSQGNPSIPSPLAGPLNCGRDQLIDEITVSLSNIVVVKAIAHQLATGSALLIQDVKGLAINGAYTAKVIDADHFSLVTFDVPPRDLTVATNSWTGGGSFTTGVASITYAGLPVPTQAKVVRLQILRNLEGNADVFYVDFDLQLPLLSAYTSVLTDEQLSWKEAVVLRTTDGMPFAFRNGVPPSNRPIICAYLGRIFAAGDVTYYAGCVAVATGSSLVQGIGTQWTSAMVGRQIFIKGSSQPYGISSISTTTQVITLTSTYSGPSQPYVTYSIRSTLPDRKVIQWCEPDRPESWPPWNAVGIPEDNDEITGLFVKASYLYIAERRHIWRFQYSGDPALGNAFLMIDSRGAINHRCIVLADDAAFLLDESGIYSYDGGNRTDPISDPIQNVFQADGLALSLQLDWTADTTLWHASHDPIRTIIRWFVSMKGEKPLTNAICYNYRLKRWWLESYPIAITSSATGTLAEAANAGSSSGSRRAISGAEARMVLVLGEGALDLVHDGGTLRGVVSDATAISITDQAASFATSLGGGTLTIVSGKGHGQQRIISSNTAIAIEVVKPWDEIPDGTSTYQLGGISWEWRSGWLDLEQDEPDTSHDLSLTYEPMAHDVQLVTQIYYDHQTAPVSWAIDRSLDGVRVREGEPDVTFELSASGVLPGYRFFRADEHSYAYAYQNQFIQIRMSGVQNNECVRVYRVSLRGVDQEGL